jgi:hypothetical protein
MPRIKASESNDPQFHRTKLKKFISSFKRWDKKGGQNYESFINKLFEIFSDDPPISWRFIVTTYEYPGFRIINRKSGKTTYFLRVADDRLIVNKIFFDERYRDLFPIDKGFYGAGDEVVLDFSKFGEKKQKLYAEAIRSMVTNKDSISINFNAYKQSRT